MLDATVVLEMSNIIDVSMCYIFKGKISEEFEVNIGAAWALGLEKYIKPGM